MFRCLRYLIYCVIIFVFSLFDANFLFEEKKHRCYHENFDENEGADEGNVAGFVVHKNELKKGDEGVGDNEKAERDCFALKIEIKLILKIKKKAL